MRLKNGEVIHLTLSRIVSNDIKKMLYKNDPKNIITIKTIIEEIKSKK